MKLITNYMKEDSLRHKLNKLTQEVFCFDFEDWVKNNYFEGEYIPFSYLADEEIASNVSVNLMKFSLLNEEINLIQIGTVMTKNGFRHQNLASSLMKMVIDTYKNQCDGIYLFGDLKAQGFYEKLGFKKINQYSYYLKEKYVKLIQNQTKYNNNQLFIEIDKSDKKLINKYLDYVKNGILYGSFEQINRFGLQMFYTQYFNNIYYSLELDTFIVLEKEGELLIVQSVICNKYIPFLEIISRINIPFNSLQLGFTPRIEEEKFFDAKLYDGGEDYRLFYIGDKLIDIENKKLFFPILSHA
ncbi:MAG: GNAT family N-acetyltransferase [Bacilli bacterium]|nr:GNAT family N-acetyltransferase [Bacillales bacterium]MDY2574588.1 GNAT family N-acetyltransferase [Bacilli bacterium]